MNSSMLEDILIEELQDFSNTSTLPLNGSKVVALAANAISQTSNVAAGLAIAELDKEPPVQIANYVESIIPLYSAEEFKAHFRMHRSTAEELFKEIEPKLQERTVSAEKKILATLWLLGNQESFRGVADRFGFSKGFLHKCFMDVVNALVSLTSKFIQWPKPDQYNSVAEGYCSLKGFPGVIGAIDGTHITIPGPSNFRESYINRKGIPSVQLQAVCDSSLKFTDVYAGWPGSVHDARVYRNSPLKQHLAEVPLPGHLHLLGDSAYPLSQDLLVPFRDNGHLTSIQKNFNKVHASTRVHVERAFGLYKGKWRRMKYLDMIMSKEIPKVIICCTVLHNFVIIHENISDDLVDLVLNEDVDDELAIAGDDIAVHKRNDIANMLA